MWERGDEVLASKLGRFGARLARSNFDQAFDDEGRLRPSCAAIGVDWRCCRVDPIDLAVDIGNVVLTRKQRRIKVSRYQRGECRQICAEVGDRVHPHTSDLAARIGR